MVVEKVIPNNIELINLFGINDNNLKYIKKIFPALKINARGNILYIEGNKDRIEKLVSLIDEMVALNQNNQTVDIPDIELLMNMNGTLNGNGKKLSTISITNNKSIKVKNVSQYKYIETIMNSTVTFGVGPAGTGKTFLAVASAVKMYSEDQIKKIVLTRPAVEAGEKLGFLPGDLSQKIDPYLVPLFDSLEYFFGNENLEYLIEKRNIEIVPLAYMRGRLGMIIDSTGRDYDMVARHVQYFKSMGYDTYMIFVNTSLDTAIDRNNMRSRKLPLDIVKTYWNRVQANIGKFQNLFGSKNFIVVDNNNAKENVFNRVFKSIRKLATKKVNNYIAKQWIDNQLRMKKLSKG